MSDNEKLPWNHKIAISIIVAGLFALVLLIGVGLVALLPNHPTLVGFLFLTLIIAGVLFVVNLPLEIKKPGDGYSKNEIFVKNLTQELERMKDL